METLGGQLLLEYTRLFQLRGGRGVARRKIRNYGHPAVVLMEGFPSLVEESLEYAWIPDPRRLHIYGMLPGVAAVGRWSGSDGGFPRFERDFAVKNCRILSSVMRRVV